ncbi:RxLR effector protein [Phytophthora megakarya]|uniref:RxLR effector protein n=1 Tax=Phytophthora megakarya TaxID=4795 RepID=A0A225WW16_9STRA|nr:RxLR effector protein [Phytophthora megakarya]
MDEMIQDIIMRMAYQHWFEGGKTTADVRLIMSLPAKGEAVNAPNWGKYLKYLEFLKEKEVQAANAAKVEAIKWRLTYKGWYLEGKTDKQVREKLGLPTTRDAPEFDAWGKYLDYLKYIEEYSQKFV